MWTPSALRSEQAPYRGRLFRIVEAQHRISTARLADDGDAQAALERLVEEVKPPLPAAARGLPYLLATPFRYGRPVESRFRRAHLRPGILYAAEHEATALAEIAYWRLVFFSRSPGAPTPKGTTELSAFSLSVKADRALDLTAPPLVADRAFWTDTADYTRCQALGDAARDADTQAIRYESVRDPEHRVNVAVLDPATLAGARLRPARTWHLRFEHGRLTALAAFPDSLQARFTPAQFGL